MHQLLPLAFGCIVPVILLFASTSPFTDTNLEVVSQFSSTTTEDVSTFVFINDGYSPIKTAFPSSPSI